MSWSELERFVADVEADRALQWAIEEEREQVQGCHQCTSPALGHC